MKKEDTSLAKNKTFLTKSSTFEFIFILTMSLLLLAFLIGLGSGLNSIQHSIFFAHGVDLFADFLNPVRFVSHIYFITGYKEVASIYPAMPILFFYPFSLFVTNFIVNEQLSAYTIMTIFIFLLIPTFLIAFSLYELKTGSKLKRLCIVFLLLFSGIYLTSLERANIAFYSVMSVFCFLSFYKSDKKVWREISLIALAVAASIKIYPALFGILLLLEKRYFDLFKAFIYALLISIIPFLIMPGGIINIIYFLARVIHLQVAAGNSSNEYMFGLNGFIPIVSMIIPKLKFLISLIEPFKFFSFIISIIGVFYIEKYWKKLLLLTILTIVLPTPSYIYTCINLFFPIILFLNEKEHTMSDWKYLILMIFILSPFQYAAPNGFLLTIFYNNIAVLIIQLLLCIEGLRAYFQKIYKHKEILEKSVLLKHNFAKK